MVKHIVLFKLKDDVPAPEKMEEIILMDRVIGDQRDEMALPDPLAKVEAGDHHGVIEEFHVAYPRERKLLRQVAAGRLASHGVEERISRIPPDQHPPVHRGKQAQVRGEREHREETQA